MAPGKWRQFRHALSVLMTVAVTVAGTGNGDVEDGNDYEGGKGDDDDDDGRIINLATDF